MQQISLLPPSIWDIQAYCLPSLFMNEIDPDCHKEEFFRRESGKTISFFWYSAMPREKIEEP